MELRGGAHKTALPLFYSQRDQERSNDGEPLPPAGSSYSVREHMVKSINDSPSPSLWQMCAGKWWGRRSETSFCCVFLLSDFTFYKFNGVGMMSAVSEDEKWIHPEL